MMKKILCLICMAVSLVACDDYLDIEPTGKIIPTTVEDYRQLITKAYSIPKNHKVLSSYRADELELLPNRNGVEQYVDIYTWNDDARSPETLDFSYQNFYSTIFYANEIINNRNEITGNKDDLEQLVGEAYALRALQYFDLINIYAKPYNAATASTDAGVPVVQNYDSDRTYPKETVAKVYDLILSDITQAEQYLNVDKQATGFNYRFSKVALYTLKSTVYLYMEDWANASTAALVALDIQSDLQDLNEESDILPSEYNSVESILALDPVSSFDIAANTLVNADLLSSYTTGDQRTAYYFTSNSNGTVFKKNANNKYKCNFRVSDLYLILSESYLKLNNTVDAKKYLLMFLVNRYNEEEYAKFDSQLNNANTSDFYQIIVNQRRLEFALEGKRWFDLRRTYQPKISKNYNTTTFILEEGDARYVIPFPSSAIINNPLL